MSRATFFSSTILMSILIIASICCIIYGIIESSKQKYEVVTFDNEKIIVNSYELYSSGMYIYKDNEKIKIKSYKKIGGEDYE